MATQTVGLVAALAVLFNGVAAGSAAPRPREPIRPNQDSATANANHIFNAVHSAGRQWGSSLNHNGFGFIPVVVPAGTLLHHGALQSDPPKGPEWLAFEPEHAEFFAGAWLMGPDPKEAREPGGFVTQKPLSEATNEDEGQVRGYFHTYQATRDLQFLYIDGMGAAKSEMGTLDSQDLVLRENTTGEIPDGFMDELNRANYICELVTEWGFDGFVRMEIGFEAVHCNFESGLHLESAVRTFFRNHKMGPPGMEFFLWSRAVGQRYDGLGGDRMRMDFSSMVSGFFFPINISNTDPQRPDLIRLGAASLEELKDIKDYTHKTMTEPRKFTVDWQAVVDMVVTRWSSRLSAMASSKSSVGAFINEVEAATLIYFEAPPLSGDISATAGQQKNRTTEAIKLCIKNYLKPALISEKQWSPQDKLIHVALESVMNNICHRAYLMRSTLIEAIPESPADVYRIKVDENSEKLKEAVKSAQLAVRELVEELAWTVWKKPPVCPYGEVLFVAMWPVGNVEDHWTPGCRSIEEMVQQRWSYWKEYGEKPSMPDPDK